MARRVSALDGMTLRSIVAKKFRIAILSLFLSHAIWLIVLAYVSLVIIIHRDLIDEKGLVIDMSEDLADENESKSYPYNPNVNLTNDEMIKMLNMEEFAEDDDEIDKTDMADAMMPWDLSFEKIKAKSEDLTNDGKIMKLIRQQGVGEVIPPDCLAIVHYGAYMEHGDEPFDTTFRRGGPARLRLNQYEILPGLEIGLRSMKKHETACFVVHPIYAYGPLGCDPLVPADTEILFIVNVVDFIDGGSADTLENLSAEEKKKFKHVKVRADVLIKTAADSFKRNKYRQAIREYSRVTAMLEKAQLEDDEEEEAMKKILSRAYGNLAICFNKENKPRQACRACLSVPNPTAKTHFHHGRALMVIGEYKRALEELQIALKQDPNNMLIINELQTASAAQRKFVESEKLLWKNCLKVRNDAETENEYEKIAKEFCESFAKNEKILRQPLPEGLTAKEDHCIREQAAKLGLAVVQQLRYGKETSYLAKSQY